MKRRVEKLTLLLIALVVGSGIVLLFNRDDLSRIKKNTVVVPEAQAIRTGDPCQNFMKFSCHVSLRADDSKDRDKLISQSIPAGQKRQSGTPIELVYSSGPVTSKVPEIRNKTLEEAQRDVYPLGLTVGKKNSENSATIPKGAIMSTKPQVGTKVTNGLTVDVVVSNGMMDVPDWTGKQKESIQAEADNLEIKVSFKEVESNKPNGYALKQSRKGLVKNSDTITIEVSKKKPTKLKIPKIVGKSRQDAITILSSTGFSNIDISFIADSKAQKETVAFVNPKEGTELDSTSKLSLVIAKKN